MQAAIARREITPPVGTYLIGYGNRLLPNIGAREPLTVTALTLREGETTVSIVACDVLALTDATYQLVQSQLDHPVLLCCSHTHCGPATHAATPTHAIMARWIVEQIVRAVRDAQAKLQPVTVQQGAGETHITVNRRQRNPGGEVVIGVNPTGPVDRSVNVLQFTAESGEPLATLVNIACHPTVLDPGNLQASGDWVAVMRAIVEGKTGAPVVFLQGACADLNPKLNHRPDDRWNIRFQIGQEAAKDVLSALRQPAPLEAHTLRHTGEYIDLPLEFDDVADLRQAVRRQFPLAAFEPLLDRFFPWQMTAHHGLVPLRVDVVRLGNVRVVGMGAEVFNEIGTAIKTPGDIVAGVTNGCIGYLPTASEHELGGYEVDVAPYFFRLPARLHPDAADVAIASVEEL